MILPVESLQVIQMNLVIVVRHSSFDLTLLSVFLPPSCGIKFRLTKTGNQLSPPLPLPKDFPCQAVVHLLYSVWWVLNSCDKGLTLKFEQAIWAASGIVAANSRIDQAGAISQGPLCSEAHLFGLHRGLAVCNGRGWVWNFRVRYGHINVEYLSKGVHLQSL